MCIYSPVDGPVACECAYQVRPRSSKLVVDFPGACDTALASLRAGTNHKQAYHVASVSVEALRVSREGGGANVRTASDIVQIDDMRQHHVCWLAIMFGVLTATERSDVTGDSSVDNHSFILGVLIDRETAENKKSSTRVNDFGEIAKVRSEGWERKCNWCDTSQRQVEALEMPQCRIDLVNLETGEGVGLAGRVREVIAFPDKR